MRDPPTKITAHPVTHRAGSPMPMVGGQTRALAENREQICSAENCVDCPHHSAYFSGDLFIPQKSQLYFYHHQKGTNILYQSEKEQRCIQNLPK